MAKRHNKANKRQKGKKSQINGKKKKKANKRQNEKIR